MCLTVELSMREHLTKASRKAKAEFSEERSPAEGKEAGHPMTKRLLVAMRLGGTPVPIPNTTVKPKTAESTALETVWEGRWPPTSKRKEGTGLETGGGL